MPTVRLVVVALVVKRLVEETWPVAVTLVKEGVEVTATVGVPVAEVRVMLEPAVRDCTPMFAIVMELVVVDREMALPALRTTVEVDTPPRVLMMP